MLRKRQIKMPFKGDPFEKTNNREQRNAQRLVLRCYAEMVFHYRDLNIEVIFDKTTFYKYFFRTF